MKKLLLFYVCLVVLFALGGSKPADRKTDAKTPKPKLILMKVTAYDPYDKHCVGRWAGRRKTATGKNAEIFDGVAADPKLLAYGTKLFIPGIGERVVDDTGSAMRKAGNRGLYHIDVRTRSHREAKRFGVQWKLVEVIDER